MVPPYSASLNRLRHHVFEFVLFAVMFVFLFYDYCYNFCPSISAFPRVTRVVLALPGGHRNACLFFRALCPCSLLFFSIRFFSFLFFFFPLLFFLFFSFPHYFFCLPFGLVVPSFGWSITSTYRRTDCPNKDKPCSFGIRAASCTHA